MATTRNKHRCRFSQFSLWTLIVLLTLFCIAVGWKMNQLRRQWEAVEWVEEKGGAIGYSLVAPPEKVFLSSYGVRDVVVVRMHSSEVHDVTPLANLTNLKWLFLPQTEVHDLTPLANLTELRMLNLSQAQVRDLTPLANLQNLFWLDLPQTEVHDLTPLANLTELRILNLSQTQVRDLTPLANLKNLLSLDVSQTKVSEEQVEGLRKALPNCGIRF